MDKRTSWGVLLGVAAVMVACAPNPASRTTPPTADRSAAPGPTVVPGDRLSGWFGWAVAPSPTCTPPCWADLLGDFLDKARGLGFPEEAISLHYTYAPDQPVGLINGAKVEERTNGGDLLILDATFAGGRLVRMHGLATGYRGQPLAATPFTLRQLLNAYGNPSIVRLNTPTVTGDHRLYQLLIVYGEQRFAVDFSVLAGGEGAAGPVCIAPETVAETNIWTWARGYAAQPTADDWRWMGYPIHVLADIDEDAFVDQAARADAVCFTMRP